jgi:hypothetical protein
VKRLITAATLALVLGTTGALIASTIDADARARVTVRAKKGTQDWYLARLPMCNNNLKGLYRASQQTDVFAQGYCLNDILPWVWQKGYRWSS